MNRLRLTISFYLLILIGMMSFQSSGNVNYILEDLPEPSFDIFDDTLKLNIDDNKNDNSSYLQVWEKNFEIIHTTFGPGDPCRDIDDSRYIVPNTIDLSLANKENYTISEDTLQINIEGINYLFYMADLTHYSNKSALELYPIDNCKTYMILYSLKKESGRKSRAKRSTIFK